MIEVLVALAIFASTVVLALSSLQFQLHRQHKIAQQHLAAHVSNNIITDLQLGTRPWPNDSTRHSIQFAERQWDLMLTPEATPVDHWKRLRIEVNAEGKTLATQHAYRQFTSTGDQQ
ncbi:hypothetical protein NBRC116587_20420 [Pseudoteredinibacter isoporae]